MIQKRNLVYMYHAVAAFLDEFDRNGKSVHIEQPYNIFCTNSVRKEYLC